MILVDLCVSAALDAVKELVTVPWASTTKPAAPSVAEAAVASSSEPVTLAESATAAAAEAQAENSWQGVEATQEPLANPDVDPAPEATESAASETAAPTAEGKKSDAPTPETKPTTPPRVLNLRHFEKAKKEITPSSSEALGSLAELRKWNDEFGEGRKDKRRKQVWGKGSFGFTNVVRDGGAGRVAVPEATPASQSQPEARRR